MGMFQGAVLVFGVLLQQINPLNCETKNRCNTLIENWKSHDHEYDVQDIKRSMVCDGQEVCVKSSTTGGVRTTTYTDCADQCCGDVNKEYCCESSNSALVIAVVATSVAFIILIIGIAICCMKNHTKQTTRVAVLHITETQNAAVRRDERRERRQREAAAAMAAYPQMYNPGYPGVPPPSYNAMYGGDNLPPGAYTESNYPPPQLTLPSTSYDGAGATGGMDAHPTKH